MLIHTWMPFSNVHPRTSLHAKVVLSLFAGSRCYCIQLPMPSTDDSNSGFYLLPRLLLFPGQNFYQIVFFFQNPNVLDLRLKLPSFPAPTARYWQFWISKHIYKYIWLLVYTGDKCCSDEQKASVWAAAGQACPSLHVPCLSLRWQEHVSAIGALHLSLLPQNNGKKIKTLRRCWEDICQEDTWTCLSELFSEESFMGCFIT